VIYLVLCDKGFPKGNAFAYLEDIQQEFGQEHGEEVATQARPYALISFGAIPFPSPVSSSTFNVLPPNLAHVPSRHVMFALTLLLTSSSVSLSWCAQRITSTRQNDDTRTAEETGQTWSATSTQT
jgi:hypothetical protein